MSVGFEPETQAGLGLGVSRPWLRFYDDVPQSLRYPRVTLYEAVMAAVRSAPTTVAIEFLGATLTYGQFAAAIDQCANALSALGMRRNDRIVIAMPTAPQAVIAMYAAIKLGAVAAMIHPLSAPPEIASYLKKSRSRFALTLDAFYGSFAESRAGTPLETLILAKITDLLPWPKRLVLSLVLGRKTAKVPNDAPVVWWSELMRRDDPMVDAVPADTDDLAVILFSGGTTGQPKGIMLSHLNFISEGMQAMSWGDVGGKDRVLAMLPIFHGFGLSALINAPLMCGACVIMLPVFKAKAVARLMRTARPTVMAGIPSLFDTLAGNRSFRRSDLSCLRGAFSGADSLPRPIKERFEKLVADRGGRVRLLEGYGLTETVTAVVAMPLEHYREGSIGIPFPDMLAKICRPRTDEELPPGEDGEICISGPAVMIGYLDDPATTAEALRLHRDGRTWLHSGDAGHMDADGFFHFICRLKRMIKTSGMNVYPTQVEAVLYQHPAIQEACVVGVPDPSLGERVRAVVVLCPGVAATEYLKGDIMDYCRQHLIRWSCPRDIVVRADMPHTRVGKIDVKTVTDEERRRP